MKLQALVPMLRTRDLDRSIAFYQDRLGFTLQSHSAADGWASLRRDGIELMLATARDDHAGLPGSLYFRLADATAVDALWAALRDHAPTCYAPDTFPYGMREFAVHDPDGVLLQFGAPAATPPEECRR